MGSYLISKKLLEGKVFLLFSPNEAGKKDGRADRRAESKIK